MWCSFFNGRMDKVWDNYNRGVCAIAYETP